MRSHRLVPERNRQRHDDTLERLVGTSATVTRTIGATCGSRATRATAATASAPSARRSPPFTATATSSAPTCRSRSTARATACASSRPCARRRRNTRADAVVPADERFESILDQIDDGCAWSTCAATTCSSTTRSAGCSDSRRREILGRSFKDLQHPDRHAQTLREIYQQVYRTGEPVRRSSTNDAGRRRPCSSSSRSRSSATTAAGRSASCRSSATARRASRPRRRLAQGKRGRRVGEPGEERVPRQHEPRDPHADERHHRHDRAGARQPR